MSELHELIAKLEKLDAEATPAPMDIVGHLTGGKYEDKEGVVRVPVLAENTSLWQLCRAAFKLGDRIQIGWIEKSADADLLRTLRNSLPTILKALKEREKMAKALTRCEDHLSHILKMGRYPIQDEPYRKVCEESRAALHAIEEQE